MDRRSFLTGAVMGAAAIPLNAFMARAQSVGSKVGRGHTSGYGPLFDVKDETTGLPLLLLPKGFRYISFGWTGDPLASGLPTPGAHDGMAAFWAPNGRTRIVRNHERGTGTPFTATAYDLAAAGGTTTMEFDTRKGKFIEAVESLSGTIRNCAGGPTPHRTWLTCEETTQFTTVPHGYVFEVPANGMGNPVPIKDMGRFSHEAVAIDPKTGYVYETEDAGNSSGFYRFVPNNVTDLHQGGSLLMLKVVGVDKANLGASYTAGTTFDVEWVPIATPDSASPTMPGNFVWSQGRALNAATFARLEGCWYGNDESIYIVSTSGGIGQGQIWEYQPRKEKIVLLFQSPGAAVLNAPDNICVSPRGGLALCEDGSGAEYVHCLTTDGDIFPFAKNNVVLNGERNGIVGSYTGSEFAGATFSPDGRWFFVNVQDPGITFAITGPWASGAL
jgi:secreted PhoX family phosphatase